MYSNTAIVSNEGIPEGPVHEYNDSWRMIVLLQQNETLANIMIKY